MRPLNVFPAIDMAYIEARCVRCEDHPGCLLWNARMRYGPIVNIDRQEWKVRHLVWRLTRVRAPQKNQIPMPKVCGNENCVAPEHLRLVRRNEHARGTPKTLLHRANMAAGKRASSQKIKDMATANAIRESDEILEVVAERHGICIAMASRIRNNEAWVDFTNPFAQLMTSP